ncbi:MAG: carbamoyl-phosphate synthase large subunit [Alphaproteobacteria bacterium]|nr:carbamoyl-phosphate synthase large subunit [Alphaproteobacteria bacterium]
MPKRTDINSILLIGAGPIIIGQACEFDYSGTQAIKALKEEGYRVILVNSNPATIMTDPSMADATYVEPITPALVTRIIEKERPDALLPTMGGQTALNTAMALAKDGTLEKHGVELIGANLRAIETAEDRRLFQDAMHKIGLDTPRSKICHTLEEAEEALTFVGLPAIIRPSFTMGGTGGGIAYNREEYETIIQSGLRASPTTEVLVEESVLGWKEYEMEVVRDRADNCIIVCSIENIDPMGIHTGDSVTVAPALTLTDKEYQRMRNGSIACLREIGVDTGGSNVQFAINPETGRMIVIEMNPRVSRSSALASKATGFPIAKVAAKLAVGYTLDEIDNDITGVTPASFEPTIDYVVTKMPRFTFEKFPGADARLTTSMKSVGEAMSIGRTFQESLQKALRSMETGLDGLDEVPLAGADPEAPDAARMMADLTAPLADRLLKVAQAFRAGLTVEQIFGATQIDPWFLRQIKGLVDAEEAIRAAGLPEDKIGFTRLKAMGFSDARLGTLAGLPEEAVATQRRLLGVHPVYKRIDTCAAEFASETPYLYSTYEGDGDAAENEAAVTDREKVMILGGGPNRIGQGIEFDYCCVHAVFALSEAGYETIMVNCNPETVSTDYDTADRLYFEPLTGEDVIEIARTEQAKGTLKGVIVQFGGQTPLKLAHALEQAKIPILGTPVDAIDLAEDRKRFQGLLQRLGLKQPENGTAYTGEEAERIAGEIGYPLVIRPSYVLGGRAMEIVHEPAQLKRYIANAVTVSGKNPVLLDHFLTHAIEVDVDALSDGEAVFTAGIMEHIEEAGIHSGDSACSLPTRSLDDATLEEIRKQTEALANGLGVVGLMNVQFAVKGDEIYILEVNPRASRTVPFVAKATGNPIAKIAARLMAGEKLSDFTVNDGPMDHVAVKEAVFPFNRFPGVDIILGPEMKSTGEVMGIDKSFEIAFAKSQLGAGVTLPTSGNIFISVKDADKAEALRLARILEDIGFSIMATDGTATHLRQAGIDAHRVKKVLEGRPSIVDNMLSGHVDLVFNTTEGAQAIADSFSLRRTALSHNIPYYTTIEGARVAVEAIQSLRGGALDVAPLQDYVSSSF